MRRQVPDMSKSTLRERRHGRLYFGELGPERWSIADPCSPALDGAMHQMRYTPEWVTRDDLWLVLEAAEAYRRLATYPLAGVAARQLRDVRRAVRDG